MTHYRRPPKPRRVAGHANPIGDVLPQVSQMLNLDKKVQEWSVMALWEKIIDASFQGATTPLKLKTVNNKTILSVEARHASVAAELMFYTHQYVERLNAFSAQTGITIHQLEIRSGGR